jgi:hypothetical protein
MVEGGGQNNQIIRQVFTSSYRVLQLSWIEALWNFCPFVVKGGGAAEQIRRRPAFLICNSQHSKNSGMDASHPEIYLSYTALIPAAPQETVGDAGIEPGTAA